MNDDVSAIPSSGCNVLSSNQLIYNYNNGVRQTFINVGGKWIKSAETTYSYSPSGYECIDVGDLSSSADLYPIYIVIAFILAVFVWWLVWRLIKPILRIRL